MFRWWESFNLLKNTIPVKCNKSNCNKMRYACILVSSIMQSVFLPMIERSFFFDCISDEILVLYSLVMIKKTSDSKIIFSMVICATNVRGTYIRTTWGNKQFKSPSSHFTPTLGLSAWRAMTVRPTSYLSCHSISPLPFVSSSLSLSFNFHYKPLKRGLLKIPIWQIRPT